MINRLSLPKAILMINLELRKSGNGVEAVCSGNHQMRVS